MTRYTEHLWRDLVRDHGTTIAEASGPRPSRASALRRPQVLAGSTLALAGAGTALALGLGALTSTPAFAVTTDSNGSVVVSINQDTSLPQANAKLTAMGIDEQVIIYMASGAAPAKGPVSCTAEAGATGPQLKVLIGTGGTEVIKPGTTGDNTGVGTWHLASCQTVKTGIPTAGNTGTIGTPGVVFSPAGGSFQAVKKG